MTKLRTIKPMIFPDLAPAVVDDRERPDIEWIAPIARAWLDQARAA